MEPIESSFSHNESEGQKISPLGFSGERELQKILREEGIDPDPHTSLEIIKYYPEIIGRIEDRGVALCALEKMLISKEEYAESIPTGMALEKKKKKIVNEIYALLDMSSSFRIFPHVMEEMIPIHQYFQFLIGQGKASKDDERLYIKKRYGWAKEEFPFEAWDAKLAALNTHWRAFVLDIISKEEFENQINTL